MHRNGVITHILIKKTNLQQVEHDNSAIEEELNLNLDIFKKIIDMNNWKLEDETTINKQWFNSKYEEFTSYGRDMEQLFTYTKIQENLLIFFSIYL